LRISWKVTSLVIIVAYYHEWLSTDGEGGAIQFSEGEDSQHAGFDTSPRLGLGR